MSSGFKPSNASLPNFQCPRGSFDNLVIVLVGRGSKKKEFQVHRGLLSYNSFKFQHVLKNGVKDDIELFAKDPTVFETVLYWMYTARFWASKTSKDGEIPLKFLHILRVYFFAAENGMVNLQNAAMTLIYQKTADRIYSKTLPTSPLRRFLIDFVADAWSLDFEATQGSVLPNRFLIDVLVSLRELKKAPGMGTNKARWVAEMNKGFCGKYHDHEL
ncbi:hypothetical protein BDU57DRAFT_583580 [Ampelomyces quisqualis]|uniref:BTB domain-containing protein n=1 Tax=Ampelomyces quisqualis TaxID=50730 RepID=A0A6A5QZQ4_AMPQU|nr:hypothetical protein BDU57DRAFT_583580 [Ampelomyces quisqualis]